MGQFYKVIAVITQVTILFFALYSIYDLISRPYIIIPSALLLFPLIAFLTAIPSLLFTTKSWRKTKHKDLESIDGIQIKRNEYTEVTSSLKFLAICNAIFGFNLLAFFAFVFYTGIVENTINDDNIIVFTIVALYGWIGLYHYIYLEVF